MNFLFLLSLFMVLFLVDLALSSGIGYFLSLFVFCLLSFSFLLILLHKEVVLCGNSKDVLYGCSRYMRIQSKSLHAQKVAWVRLRRQMDECANEQGVRSSASLVWGVFACLLVYVFYFSCEESTSLRRREQRRAPLFFSLSS